MAMIEVEDLRKNYGTFRALLGVTFQVDRGEILGFLGPNGAGKTTAMKILTGFLNPSFGRAVVDGHDVLENSVEVRRKIGYLPENTPLYDDMSVKEYLRYCGALRRMNSGRLRQRIDAVVTMTGLQPKFRALIKTLSKGYRQRVGIAQALLHEPEIIILDEPTVGLDPNQVVEVRNLIREVGQGRTVILCSHILSEVEATCSRVVIIHLGRIVADGTPAALSEQYRAHAAYEVSALGTQSSLIRALEGLSGISNLVPRGEYGGVATARFESARMGSEIGGAVSAALADADLRLVSLVPFRTSLEDVFRGLTGKQEKV
jgi:ABC-2 type transport system ATP-binding protein